MVNDDERPDVLRGVLRGIDDVYHGRTASVEELRDVLKF